MILSLKNIIRFYVYFEIINLSLTAISKGDAVLLSIISAISFWVLVHAFPIFPYYNPTEPEDE